MRRFAGAVQPSFWEGMARIVDIGGTLQEEYVAVHHNRLDRIAQSTRRSKKRPLNPNEADASALVSDWGKVTHDLLVVESKIKSKYTNHCLDRQQHA